MLRIRQGHVNDDVIPLSDNGLSYLANLDNLEELMYCQGRRAASTILVDPLTFQGHGLAHLSLLTNLTNLNVSCSDLESPHVRAITTLQSLVVLNISWCPWFQPSDWSIFPRMPNLKKIYCRGVPFVRQWIKQLKRIKSSDETKNDGEDTDDDDTGLDLEFDSTSTV